MTYSIAAADPSRDQVGTRSPWATSVDTSAADHAGQDGAAATTVDRMMDFFRSRRATRTIAVVLAVMLAVTLMVGFLGLI